MTCLTVNEKILNILQERLAIECLTQAHQFRIRTTISQTLLMRSGTLAYAERPVLIVQLKFL